MDFTGLFSSDSSNDSGSGGALDAIDNLIGVGAGAASTIIAANQGQPVYGSYGPGRVFGTGSAATYASAAQPSSMLLWIVVLVGGGILAFKAIK